MCKHNFDKFDKASVKQCGSSGLICVVLQLLPTIANKIQTELLHVFYINQIFEQFISEYGARIKTSENCALLS